LAWADKVLETHADRRAIIDTHMDLGPIDEPANEDDFTDAPKGKMNWIKIHGARGNSAVAMWNKCFRKHANLFMIVCGDQSRSCALYLKSIGDNGNTVHEMLSDYGSVGPLRLLRFVPSENTVHVITYDTTLRERTVATKYVPHRDSHQFSVSYAMRP
ncbi:MAG TPA: serine/threonine protein phosphatase, partial [Pirellulales bacterium]|jgi:hypothetical protein|nr:serine/threonine protein phosphatase [Pirellulales bacterium]